MKEAILERFLRYVAVTSQSDGKAGVVPSTEGQRKLAGMLAEELVELGFVNIEISEYSVLTALLPGNLPDNKAVPTVGWCCHLDTVDAGLSPDVHPQVIRGYLGGDICLNKEKDLWMRTSEHPEIEKYVGDDIVVTDGTSVLGADNKSAIANVMTAFDIVVKENRPHGDIYVAFVPDEEIGLLLNEAAAIYPHLRLTRINAQPNYEHSIKLAITVGIKAAAYEHMVFTTVDS